MLTVLQSSGILPVKAPINPVDNEVTLYHCAVDAYQTIRNCPGIFESTRWSMMRRVQAWIESRGGDVQQLLQMYSFSYNSEIKCFQTHGDTLCISGSGGTAQCIFILGSVQKWVVSFTHQRFTLPPPGNSPRHSLDRGLEGPQNPP
jgi:hypothetical protein